MSFPFSPSITPRRMIDSLYSNFHEVLRSPYTKVWHLIRKLTRSPFSPLLFSLPLPHPLLCDRLLRNKHWPWYLVVTSPMIPQTILHENPYKRLAQSSFRSDWSPEWAPHWAMLGIPSTIPLSVVEHQKYQSWWAMFLVGCKLCNEEAWEFVEVSNRIFW